MWLSEQEQGKSWGRSLSCFAEYRQHHEVSPLSLNMLSQMCYMPDIWWHYLLLLLLSALQESWADQIRQAGFRAVTYENLTGGVVAIHSGFKL
jgi:hypothetical protein